MSKKITLVFFGTSEYSVQTLKALFASDRYLITAVVTQSDKPIGRKQVLTPTPVKLAALELGLPVFEHPKDVINISADIGVLVYYGKILSKKVLEAFPFGIINIHPSLLPAWRGPSPAQAAILAGDVQTGVTVMKLDTAMDTGPILAQQAIPIHETDTAQNLYDALFPIGIDLLLKCLPDYIEGKCVPVAQSTQNLSYSHIINREDGKISAQHSPRQIVRMLRALHPWPGVYCIWQGRRVKILSAHLEADQIVFDQLQMEGKKPMNFVDFMRGYPDFSLTNIS